MSRVCLCNHFSASILLPVAEIHGTSFAPPGGVSAEKRGESTVSSFHSCLRAATTVSRGSVAPGDARPGSRLLIAVPVGG